MAHELSVQFTLITRQRTSLGTIGPDENSVPTILEAIEAGTFGTISWDVCPHSEPLARNLIRWGAKQEHVRGQFMGHRDGRAWITHGMTEQNGPDI